MKISRWIGLVIGLTAMGTVGYLVYAWANSSFVPEQFLDGRRQGAVISQEISGLLGESLQNLDSISQHDQNYNFSAALELVRQELERANEAREKAISLTSVLDAMVKSVPEISPLKARGLAMAAVTEELSLIGRLVKYSDILNSLLETLQYKFSGDIRYDAGDVQELISQLNEEAKEINNLSVVFNEAMQQFDLAVK